MATEEPLLERTYRLLDETTLSYRDISAGAGVGLSWIAKFAQRNIEEPGVNKVEAVFDFLSANRAAEPEKPPDETADESSDVTNERAPGAAASRRRPSKVA